MRIKELLSGLTEDVGPGRDWDPHSMGAPGSVPPFMPSSRGLTPPTGPAPITPAMPQPAAAAMMPQMADSGPSVGQGRDWDPHSMGAPGAIAPFAGSRAGAPAPINPMPMPMEPNKTA